MSDTSASSRLSEISTRQTEYQKAIERYLLGALRDPPAAEEVFQRFATEFLSGRMHRWDPSRERLRNYLKAVLIRLANDYRKEQRDARIVARGGHQMNQQVASENDSIGRAPAPDNNSDEPRDFDEAWRSELLAHTWAALSDLERQSGQLFFTVLRFRSENPKVTSAEMAQKLTEQLKSAKPFTDTGIRKTLERAREKFANLLIDEVARSLGEPSLDELEQELIDLRLLGYHYCREVLRQRRENR